MRIFSKNIKIQNNHLAKSIFFTFFLLGLYSVSFSQLSSKYTFTYNGTTNYVAAVAGTNLATGAASGTDAVWTNQAIGFTFTFNCVDYTTCGISQNGFIWFGTGTCATNQYTPLSSTTGQTGTVDGIISVYGANLTNSGTSATANYVRTQLTGTAPNRVFTIEWRKMLAGGSEVCDHQIKLYETSNQIDLIQWNNPYLVSGTSSGQVGMRGSVITDFLNRKTSGGTICAPLNGTLNTDVIQIFATTTCGYAASASSQQITYKYTFTGSCCTTPATQPTAAGTSGITLTTANLNWTPGSGSGGDIVFLKQGSAITTDPSNATTYIANSVFGSGTQIGTTGAFAIYSGMAGSTAISNLQPSTTYYYKIYTFDAAGPCYLAPTTSSGSFTTTSCSPTIQASSPSILCITGTTLNLRFTRGNGSRVIVVGRAGSSVNADPAYNTVYTANASFGSGSQIGVGNYVVYDGNDPGTVTIPITGLTAGTTYYFNIYEYNGPPNCYNTVSPATTSGSTISPGVYVSSTATQNSTNVAPGALAQDIIKLNIVIGGGIDLAATLNNIVFTTTGSTNTTTDLTNAKIFYTGNSNVFSNATQYGTTFTSFAGSLTATANFALLPGNNYFWIAYDVKATATGGDVLDATVTSFNLTDNTGTANYIPAPTAPAGSRLIAAPVGLVYCSGVIPTATCAGTGCNFSCSQGENLSSISITGSTIISFSGWPCNSTCGTNTNSYTDMFLLNKYSLNQGTTNNMSIVFSTWFSMQMNWAIWVDWNQDGVFTNASPERFPASGSIDEWTSQNIIVPASVSSGRHRARLWMQEFSYPPTTPCRTSSGPLTTSIGQIVDFDIEVPDGSLPNLDPAVVTGGVSCATLAPIVVTPINYAYGAIASQLTATGTNLLWYTSLTGGVGSATAPTPTTTTTGTQVYYVSQNNGSCEGPRIQIAVNVLPPPIPVAPLAAVTQPTCAVANGMVAFSGLPSSGIWTINPNGISGSGSTYTLSPVAPGSYNYTIINSAGCMSPTSVNAVINTQPATPSAPVVSTVIQPAGAVTTGSVVLTGLPADGWIINPGAIVGAVGVTSLTISGLTPGTYTYTVTNMAGCTSAATTNIIITLPLPIELVYFNATFNGIDVDLTWSTSSEKNNDYFTVEKSKDAFNFKNILTKKGAGNSSSLLNYYAKDLYPFSETSYYRLKQTDFDGNSTYSKSVSVNFKVNSSLEIISINKESENSYNACIKSGEINFDLQIINMTGKIVFSSEHNSLETSVMKINFDTHNFEKGIYLLKIIGSQETQAKKFIIY